MMYTHVYNIMYTVSFLLHDTLYIGRRTLEVCTKTFISYSSPKARDVRANILLLTTAMLSMPGRATKVSSMHGCLHARMHGCTHTRWFDVMWFRMLWCYVMWCNVSFYVMWCDVRWCYCDDYEICIMIVLLRNCDVVWCATGGQQLRPGAVIFSSSNSKATPCLYPTSGSSTLNPSSNRIRDLPP